jgi:hypothetical protein
MSQFAAERGWTLDVITLDPDDQSAPDRSRLVELPPGTRVYGVREPRLWVRAAEEFAWRMYRTIRPRQSRAGNAAGGAPLTVKVETSTAPSELHWPPRRASDFRRAYYAGVDYLHYVAWARAAQHLGERLLRDVNYAALISCGPPHTAHLATLYLSRRTRLPMIVDMRDPWSQIQRLPEAVASPLWWRLARHYERDVLHEAAMVAANTEPARDALQALYPEARDRIIAVMNGYDDEPLPPANPGACFTVTYAGTVYLDRDPSALFLAASRLISRLRLTPGQFAIQMIGDVEGAFPVAEMIARDGLAGFVNLLPRRPRGQLMRDLASAAMLVSLPQDSTMAIPSKIFEYIRFPAWVLALTDAGSATEAVLRDTGADVVRPGDVDGIEAVLLRRYMQFAAGERPQPVARDTRLSRRYQAGVFLDTLERCINGSFNPVGS